MIEGEDPQNPPQNGEGDRAKRGGGAGHRLTGPRSTVLRSRRLRRELSLPEVILWRALRTRPNGLKFRKQHPAGVYILDFYCAAAKLAVEVDGAHHGLERQAVKDSARDQWPASWNVRTLRIPATAILDDVAAVVAHIVAHASPDQPLHQPAAGPPPRAGED